MYLKLVNLLYCMASSVRVILGDPAAVSRQDAIFSAGDILEQNST